MAGGTLIVSLFTTGSLPSPNMPEVDPFKFFDFLQSAVVVLLLDTFGPWCESSPTVGDSYIMGKAGVTMLMIMETHLVKV